MENLKTIINNNENSNKNSNKIIQNKEIDIEITKVINKCIYYFYKQMKNFEIKINSILEKVHSIFTEQEQK